MALKDMQLQAIQEVEDIESGKDTRTLSQRVDDQMAALTGAAKTIGEFAVDATPVVGDIKGAVELPEDVRLIQDLVSEGYDEGSISKMGLGGLYGIATALGFIPAIGAAGDATKAGIKSAVKSGKSKPPKKPAFQPEWRKKQIEQVKAKYSNSSSRRRALREINRPPRKVFHGAQNIGQTINEDAFKQVTNDLSVFNNIYVDRPIKDIFGDNAEVAVETFSDIHFAGKNLRFPMAVNTKDGPRVTYAIPVFSVNKSGNYATIDLHVIDPDGDNTLDTITNVVEVVDGKIKKADIVDLAADTEIDSINAIFPEATRTMSRGDEIASEGFKPFDEFEGSRGLSGPRASGRHFELKEKALSTSLDPLVSMKPSFGGRATQNVVYSELPRSAVRDMSAKEYDDLVLFGGARADAQNITPKGSNAVGAQLPKSRHLEGEVAITYPETLTPSRLGKGEVNPQFTAERGAKDIGNMDLEQRVAYGQRLANSIISRTKDFQTQFIKSGSSGYDSAAEAVADYGNLRTILQDLQSLGNFTEQYGARGTYDSLLLDLARDAGNVKKLADALPKGEKKANALMLHSILDAIDTISLNNSATRKAVTRTRGLPDSLLLKLSDANDAKGVKLTKDEFDILSDANIQVRSDIPGDVDLSELGYNDLKRMLFLQTDKFNQGGLVMNKGGAVPMKKQMELFEDGGLKDEGGTVDPVSGNDVPVGSTQEEVRDDIPAQLSEGEFVLSADVVRYHGLDKIMQLRDEAKAGLARMEAMGQMGNSDEATIPDGVPFDINDLDIEDDGEYNYQVGGLVPPQGLGIVGYQPSQFQTYQPQYTSYQPVPIQTEYQPPQAQPVPTMQPPTQMPTFEQFIQPPEGTAPENREYINPQTGERRIFTFIGGNPTVEIPEGFIPISEYTEPPATEITTTPTVGQARVTEIDGDDGPPIDRDAVQEQRERIAAAKRLGINEAVNPFTSILGYGEDDVGKFTNTGFIVGKGGVLLDPLTGLTREKSSPNIIKGILDAISGSGEPPQVAYSKEFFDAMPDNARDVLNRSLGKDARDERISTQKFQREIAKTMVEEDGKNRRAIEAAQAREKAQEIAENRREIAAVQARARAEIAARENAQQAAQRAQREAVERQQDRDSGGSGQTVQERADSYTADRVAEAMSTGQVSRGFAEGGLAKQMKKSGLTSKK